MVSKGEIEPGDEFEEEGGDEEEVEVEDEPIDTDVEVEIDEAKKGDRKGETKEISIDFKDTDSGIVVKHKMKFNESVNEGRMGKAVINQELKNMKSVKDFDALFTKMWNGDEDKLFMSLYHLVEEPKLQKAFFDAIKANLKKYPDGIV
jgi:hypothetical protein